ncbi:MAG: tetratricopeptide repeat protein [Crocinitomicaceae bacterium]|nr:tetratricopeptide repeat protein [Crocinitomicaceae bacterium]
MGTFKDENPITYRIEQMRKKWVETVCDPTQLVRWVLLKDEVRMFKAFSMLEASEHGQISDLFLNFDVSFGTEDQYGRDLLESWLLIWDSEDARKEVEHADVIPDWDAAPYRNPALKDSEKTFLAAMSSFATSIDPEQQLVLGVMPADYHTDSGFTDWVLKCLEIMPENLKFMVYDLHDRPTFHKVPMDFKVSTLVANLDMAEATREIVRQGDLNDPAVGVNLCVLNISEAANNGDEDEIHHWGKEGVEIAEKTGLKSIVATVYLAYGSGFYQLKKFKEALRLYEAAEEQAISGLENGDIAVPAVLLQCYNFQAATYLYKKKYEEAREYFLKASEESLKQKNMAMYMEAQRQASVMSEKMYDTEKAYSLIADTYEMCKPYDKLILKFTSMLLICLRYHEFAYDQKNRELVAEIDEFATGIWGEQWKDISEKEVYENILTEE